MAENDENKKEEIVEEVKDETKATEEVKENIAEEKTESAKVEQLDDVEFEKEEKEKKTKFKKKNIILLIVGIVLLIAACVAAFLFINRETPENLVQDFVTNLNAQDFEKVLGVIDIKGYYSLNTTYNGEEVDENTNFEKYYTKFDERYAVAGEDEDYKELLDVFEGCDKENLKTLFEGMEFKITEMSDPVLIQNTKGLYKITTNIDMTYQGETESAEYDFYVNKTKVNLFKTEYKIVGGDVPGTVLYMMFLSEYYNDLYSEMETAQ